MENTNCSIQSLQRAFNILEFLSNSPYGAALTEISVASGLSKSTTHRFLTSLADLGYVVKNSSEKYQLTLRMFEIGGRAVRALDIVEAARPILDRMAEATKETVHLVVRDGNQVVYIYKRHLSAIPINMSSLVGNCSPIYCTGVGKAIFAYLPEEERREIWNSCNIQRFTPNTITDFQAMEEELQRVRDRGYAIDNEEHELGIYCIAIPIFDHACNPKYAISITFPHVRLSDELRDRSLKLLYSASLELSRLCGLSTSSYHMRIPRASF